MSTALILVIVIGGTLLIAGAITWFAVWSYRSSKRDNAALLQRLREEASRRGWRYEERNDSYCAFYSEGDQSMLVSIADEIFSPRDIFARPPEALEAHEIVSGTHRGRPFLSARLRVRWYQSGIRDSRVVWVRAPKLGPALQVMPAVPLASRVNDKIKRGDLKVGDPEFDERYQVSTGDERFARAVLVPQVTHFLKTDPRKFRGFTLLGANLDFLDSGSDQRDPEKLVAALDLRCDLLDLVPRSVWA
ncbi:hypothetical protein VSH64_47485 [Amycolatopsis rhabdoformis]|uniref:DUF3137 domain-containing protein n=1 Tax=Amycolatopsis rhabdoformis TaxID=1448059 RepID=A0ABZ1I885_9PSEU|nr:hypothetical protein [Amycolatopsis rhabdoformis]WSE30352.1 hypothetical protein VSH64_47485 [Amycolatopsis rhabdoformis]